MWGIKSRLKHSTAEFQSILEKENQIYQQWVRGDVRGDHKTGDFLGGV